MNSPNVKVHARDIDSMITHLFVDGSMNSFQLQKQINIQLERIEIEVTNSLIDTLSIIYKFKPLATTQIISKCELDIIEEKILSLKANLLLIMDKRTTEDFLYFIGGLRSLYLCLLEIFSAIKKIIHYHTKNARPNISKLQSLSNIIEENTGWNWNNTNNNTNNNINNNDIDNINNNEDDYQDLSNNLTKSGSKFSLFSNKSSYSALHKQDSHEIKISLSNAKLFKKQLQSTNVILDHVYEKLQIILEFWEIKDKNQPQSRSSLYNFIPFKCIHELYKNHKDLDATKVSGIYHFGFTYTKSLLEYSKKLKAMYCAVNDAQTWKDSAILSSTWFYSAAAHYFLAPDIASSYYEKVRSNLNLSVQRNVWNLMEDPIIEFFATALGLNPKKIILPIDSRILIESSVIPITIEQIDKIITTNHANETQLFSEYEEKKVLITCHYLFSREIILDSSLYSTISEDNNDNLTKKSFSFNSIRELLNFNIKSSDNDPTLSNQRNINIKTVSKQLSEISVKSKGYSVISEDNKKISESTMYNDKQSKFEKKRNRFLDEKINTNTIIKDNKNESHEDINESNNNDNNINNTKTINNNSKIGKILDLDINIIQDTQCSTTLSYTEENISNSPTISKSSHLSNVSLKEYDPVILLHIHGGGWISQSPKTHLSYLRTWAKLTNLPILSIDYDLSPEHEFPHALNQCYATYIWLLNPDNAQKIGLPTFNSPPRIILAGDSAGGNLCCALTIKLIQEYMPLPIGILLSYPVVNLTACGSISRMIFSHDPVLNYQSMQIVLNSYLGSRVDLASSEPLISPGIVSDDILCKFPQTYIMVGDTDPIIDDSTYFFQRLRNVGVTTKLKIYSKLPHGYLNLPSQLPNAPQAISDAAKYIKKIMHDDDKKKGFTIV